MHDPSILHVDPRWPGSKCLQLAFINSTHTAWAAAFFLFVPAGVSEVFLALPGNVQFDARIEGLEERQNSSILPIQSWKVHSPCAPHCSFTSLPYSPPKQFEKLGIRLRVRFQHDDATQMPDPLPRGINSMSRKQPAEPSKSQILQPFV